MLNIVLFGAPGAGKGTQAEMLLKKYDLVHLSTGDMLRGEIARGSERGKVVQQLIDRGQFAPDRMVVEMVEEKIQRHKSAQGFIFDGFPRTIPQAEMLDRMLSENGLHIHTMMALDAPEDELVQRLLSRGKVSGRTDDQNEGVIRDRIVVYNEKTAPLIDYYQQQGKHTSVKGVGGVEEIFDRLCATIDKIMVSC